MKKELKTFDNFIVGDNNEFAWIATKEVATIFPKVIYSPLYIYGEIEADKSHLLQASYNYITKNNPQANVLYITGKEFVNELINSIKNNELSYFSDRYRKLNVLILEDIQDLSEYKNAHNELWNLLNAYFYETNTQMIISSDRPPRKLGFSIDPLMAKLEWGLVTEITRPKEYKSKSNKE